MDIEFTKEEFLSFLEKEKDNRANTSYLRASLKTAYLYSEFSVERMLEELKTSCTKLDVGLIDALTGPLVNTPLWLADESLAPIAQWRLDIGK